MNKKQVIVFAVLLVATLSSSYFALSYHNDMDKTKNISYDFSEKSLSHNELIELSEFVVKGKIIKFKENKIASKKQVMDNGNSFNLKFPYSVYTLEITDNLKGTIEKNKVEIVFVGDKPDYISLGKEYMLFLVKNNIDKDKYYSLLSYSQGFYELDSDTGNWKNKNMLKEFKEKDVINKINEHKY